jgi:hypothetical protein
MPITKIIELIWYFVKSPRYPIKEFCKEINVDKKVVIQRIYKSKNGKYSIIIININYLINQIFK